MGKINMHILTQGGIMQKFIGVGLVAFICCSITGCDNAKSVSKANFAKAIQKYYNQVPTSDYCLTRIDVFPASMDEDQQHYETSKLKAYETLVATGLLTVKEDLVKKQTFLGPEKQVKAKVFDLTAKGKQYYKDADAAKRSSTKQSFFGGNVGLCYAEPKVEIINYTEPADAGGVKMSEVKFKVNLTHVADWAKDKKVQEAFPTIAENLKQAQEDRAPVILTSEGWVHASLLK